MAPISVGFTERVERFDGVERTVVSVGEQGAPVVVLHELFGMTDTLASFCRTIAAAGFVVHVPILFGSTQIVASKAEKAARIASGVCVLAQMRCFAGDASGFWAPWLRALATSLCPSTPGAGVGVIGLCLTGDFALAMAANPQVKAAVMAEPSLPFLRPHLLHVTPDELRVVKSRIDDPTDGLRVRGYRYTSDRLCPQAKFERLKSELGGGFEGVSLPASEPLHSVFTEDLRDGEGHLRHDKIAEVVAFLHHQLATGEG